MNALGLTFQQVQEYEGGANAEPGAAQTMVLRGRLLGLAIVLRDGDRACNRAFRRHIDHRPIRMLPLLGKRHVRKSDDLHNRRLVIVSIQVNTGQPWIDKLANRLRGTDTHIDRLSFVSISSD